MSRKKFRVVRAGQTTDGREVTVEQIQQMAASYSPATYGARINLEHIRGTVPGSPFGSYGDVTALSVETEGNHTYLVAEIDPTEELVNLARARQKVYFSIEMDPKFAGTDQAYLVGLAVTDSPASLGTTYMAFCAGNPGANPFQDRKRSPHNLFSSSEMAGVWPQQETGGIAAAVRKLFTKDPKHQAEIDRYAAAVEDLPQSLQNIEQALQTIAQANDQQNRNQQAILERLDKLETTQQSQQSQLDQFSQKLDNTPSHFNSRPLATGGDPNAVLTDC